MPARIAIVEDIETIANEVERLVQSDTALKCVGKFATAEKALRQLPALMPDLCVLDIGLPRMDGLAALKVLKKKIPQMKVVIFSVFEDSASIVEAIQNGANGYLLKDTDRRLLISELKVILQGGATLTPRVALKIAQMVPVKNAAARSDIDEDAPQGLLTERQIAILNHMAIGFDYKEIADELNISEHTVRRHIENIYTRLEVHNRQEAIRAGFKFGFMKNLGRWIS